MSIAARRSHRGDEYQLKIAVHWIARLLSNDELDWIQVDCVVLPGKEEQVFVDDVVAHYKNGTTVYIQAKIHQPDRRTWTIKEFADELVKARDQLEKDSVGKIFFYSETPFSFAKLIEDSSNYETCSKLLKHAPKTLCNLLTSLAEVLNLNEEEAFNFCTHINIGAHHTLKDWNRLNHDQLALHITNPDKAIPILESLARKNQAGLGSSFLLTREIIESELAKVGIVRASQRTEAEILACFKSASSVGRHELSRTIAGIKLVREEIAEINELLNSGGKSILLVDRPGSGKSWILLEIADLIESECDMGLLFIKGDFFDGIDSEETLQTRLGLHDDIVDLAARLTTYRKVVVIIDSLDALSLSRDQKALKVFLALIDRLLIVEGISLVLACRDFDLSYDPLLRDREWGKKINIRDLDFGKDISPVLEKWGIDPVDVSDKQRKLLTVPRNLKFYEKISDKVPLDKLTTSYHFPNVFIDEVVLKNPKLGYPALSIVQEMASNLMEQRSLFLHSDGFKGDGNMLKGLISEEVLQIDTQRNRLAFTHQTLLDTLITRESLTKCETLEKFILKHPPLPFIRPAVRTFLFNIRAHVPDKFTGQVKRVFENDNIAYHLKRLTAESLAELSPTNDDSPLFGWLMKNHTDFFRRFLWQLKGTAWFDFLSPEIFENILNEADESLQFDLVAKLREWMNLRPNEVIAFWKRSIDDGVNYAVNEILFSMDKFEHWQTDGVRELLEALIEKVGYKGNHHEIGHAISRYVQNNNDGDEILWNYITANVDDSTVNMRFFHAQEGGLQCAPYDFHTKSFLKETIGKSEYLLDKFLIAIEEWSFKGSYSDDKSLFRSSFLTETSWEFRHSKHDMHLHSNLFELLEVVGAVMIERSKKHDTWWQKNEPVVRQTKEAAIAYLLMQAYRANIKDNITQIMGFLDREEIFRSQLSCEIGELIKDAFPELPNNFQEALQRKILYNLYSEHRKVDNNNWVYREIYKYFCCIPVIFRLTEVQEFIEEWKDEFGLWPQPPEIHSTGGIVGSPVSVENMMSLSDETIIKLIQFYDKSKNDWEWRDGLVGGTDQVIPTFRDCCANNPERFSSYIETIHAKDIYKRYAIAVLEGFSIHLKYRFGRLQPSSEWKPVEPLPDGRTLAVFILKWLDTNDYLWNDGYATASALESCCHVLEEPDEIEWLITLLNRLSTHPDPGALEQRIFPSGKEGITEDDLSHDALNSVRGIVAEGAIYLATRLLEKDIKLPKLLYPLLSQLARDSHAGVRTAILMHLPLLAYHDYDLGWTIFEEIFIDPHKHLWSHGETFLYYQYHNRFDKVKPYLDRIKVEVIETAGKVWGSISTLALLSGHITEEQLFSDLVEIDSKGVWRGVLKVFTANIDNAKNRRLCESGIFRILQQDNNDQEILKRIDWIFEKIKADGNDFSMQIAEKYIEVLNNGDDMCRLHWFYDWFEKLADNEPIKALSLGEKLLGKIEALGSQFRIWRDDEIVSAAVRILREADEQDDPELIKRAIAFQDRLLKLNIRKMQEALDKAGRE